MKRRNNTGPVAPRGWYYQGDINIEHGGYFANLSTWSWGYVDVIRVTPCSDADGPDNEFWIEVVNVNLPGTKAAIKGILFNTFGQAAVDEYRASKPRVRKAMLVDACLSYGKYDVEETFNVRIGKTVTMATQRKANWDDLPTEQWKLRQFRAGTSLGFIVRKLNTEW